MPCSHPETGRSHIFDFLAMWDSEPFIDEDGDEIVEGVSINELLESLVTALETARAKSDRRLYLALDQLHKRRVAENALEVTQAELRGFHECTCPVTWDRSCPSHVPAIG